MNTDGKRGAKGSRGRRSLWQMDLADLGRGRGVDDDAPVVREPFSPRLPSVDLLPRSVRDSVRIGRMLRGFIAVLVLILALAAGIWFLQDGQISQASADVETAQATNERVRKDLEALDPVRQMYEQITRLQGVVTDTLAAQPKAAFIIEELLSAGEQAAGSDADFSSIDVVYSGIPEPGAQLNPCPNPDPFGSPIAFGCVTFTASMASREQVSELLRALEQNPLFVGPYVTTSTTTSVEGEKDSVSFTGSAGLSLDGLVTGLTAEQIDAIVNPPQPDEAAEPTGDGSEATAEDAASGAAS